MDVQLTVELPPETENRLLAESPNLPSAVREGFLVNLFRRSMLSHHELGRALNLDRFETDALLKRHTVTEQALSHAEVDADVQNLRDVLGSDRHAHDRRRR